MNNFETLLFKNYLHYHIVIKHPYDVDTMFIHNIHMQQTWNEI